MCVAVCDGGSFSFLFLSSPCFYQRADLRGGVTDEGLCALASAGCGGKLTLLHLSCACCPVCDFVESGWACWICVADGVSLSPLFTSCCVLCKRADLWRGVTDEGLHAFASGGCGAELTSLHLQGEYYFVPLRD